MFPIENKPRLMPLSMLELNLITIIPLTITVGYRRFRYQITDITIRD